MILFAMFLIALSAPAVAGYPVSGKWGQSASSEKGPIDCAGKRVIDFRGDQRTDSQGGVPAYRLKSSTQADPGHYRIVDEFSTGQINNARMNYTLQQVDADHIAMNMQPGGLLKLQRCK